jgi:hypothetical protein
MAGFGCGVYQAVKLYESAALTDAALLMWKGLIVCGAKVLASPTTQAGLPSPPTA